MQIIKTLCDRAHSKGDEQEADYQGVVLTLNKRAVEMDLSAEALEELQGFLEPWFEIGRRPGSPPSAGAPRSGQARPRRQFSTAFMAEIAKECIDGGASISQISAERDLTETAVRRWVADFKAGRLVAPTSGTGHAQMKQDGDPDGRYHCRWPDGECDDTRDNAQGRSMHERKAHDFFFNQLSEEDQAKVMKKYNKKIGALVSG